MNKTMREAHDKIAKEWADKGMIIEGGWQSLHQLAIGPIPKELEVAFRRTFYAGAQHLFACIVAFLEPGEEPTENDLMRMDKIQKELDQFRNVMNAEAGVKP